MKKIILLMMLCVIFLTSCQAEENHPIFRQSSKEIFELWMDMTRHSSEFLRIKKQSGNLEQEQELNIFVYQMSTTLANLSIIGDLLNEKYLTNPSIAAYLFGMVNGLIYQNNKIIRQSSEIISSSDNQALKESYRKTIPYLHRMNVILEPLEIPLIKASGDDPKKVKEQLEWLWEITVGKS